MPRTAGTAGTAISGTFTSAISAAGAAADGAMPCTAGALAGGGWFPAWAGITTRRRSTPTPTPTFRRARRHPYRPHRFGIIAATRRATTPTCRNATSRGSRFPGNRQDGWRRIRSKKPSQIGADALQHGRLRLGHGKTLAGDRLEHADIDPRGLGDDVARDRRDRIAIGVDAGRDPAPHEILVEAVGRLAGREPAAIALGEPVAAAVRGMDL